MKEYQPNSHRSKETQAVEPVREKKIEKVVTGKVQTRENKGRKFADIFISEDAANVKSYILMDVLVPAFKKLVSDIVTDGIDMILYGGTGRSSGNRKSSGSNISYRSYYDNRRDDRRDNYDTYDPRRRFEYREITYASRGDAEAVRRQMLDTIRRYGMVTVADMYDMSGETAPYTSCDYGWMNERAIETAETVRVRDGRYVLNLPKATPID